MGMADCMSKSAEDRRALLRKFMNERKLKAARWAKAAGVSPNSLYNFLNGHSENLDALTIAKMARAEGVPPWRISGEEPQAPSPTAIWVVGYVEAGVFRDAVEWDQSLWYAIDVPVPQRYSRMTKALEVRGPSMNLEYREGAIVLWVDVLDARLPQDGDHVIAYAHHQDDTVEATVKELRVIDGKRWLFPRSNHPQHQAPVDSDNPGDHVKMIEIKGLVVGDYRPRII